jgi:hypothetical protein
MAASTINTECKRYGCMKNLLACFANCRYTMRCDELRNELVDKAPAAESDINRYLSERGRSPVIVQILKRGVKFDDKAARPPRQPIEVASTSVPKNKPRLKLQAGARPTSRTKRLLAASASSGPAQKRAQRMIKAHKPAAVAKVKSNTKHRAVQSPKLQANRPGIAQQTDRLSNAADFAAPRPASLRLTKTATGQQGEARSRKKTTMPRRARSLVKANAVGIENPAAPPREPLSLAGKSDPDARPTGERAAPRKKAIAKSRKSARNNKIYIIIEGQTASIVDEQGLMMHLFGNHSKNARYFEASEVEARVQIMPKR